MIRSRVEKNKLRGFFSCRGLGFMSAARLPRTAKQEIVCSLWQCADKNLILGWLFSVINGEFVEDLKIKQSLPSPVKFMHGRRLEKNSVKTIGEDHHC